MVIFKKVADLQEYLTRKKAEKGQNTGFVPTMGALHAGHTALVEAAKKDDNIVITSIFVNPTQFNDKEDFNKYPISADQDTVMLAEASCDVLFMPGVEEIYPSGEQNMPAFSFGGLDNLLEGAHRPGHFKGVGQVVARLLDIVQPDRLYMGQKDYQQCMVVKNLLTQTGSGTELIICPTVREADGLAMSSRNRRLTEPQRALAGLIYQCLVSIQAKQLTNPFSIVQKECTDLLAEKGFDTEYVSLANADDLSPLQDYQPGKKWWHSSLQNWETSG